MRLLVIFLIILNCFKLNGQTYSRIISDSEIVEFINSDIQRDSIKKIKAVQEKIYPLNPDDFYYKDSIDFKAKNDKNSSFIFIYHKVNKKKILTNDIDTLFSREDIDFFYKQLKGLRRRHYWKNRFDNSAFINDIELDSNNYAKQTMYSYSVPLFSRDKTRVIIIKSFLCGMLCGGGGYYIYQKTKNGDWQLIKIINRWAN
jgi:hypothetical protein